MKRLSPLIAILFGCFLFLVGISVVDAKIVFCIEDDIYVMDDDGTNRLTKNTETKDVAPRWSPDGERIAFYRYMNKNDQKSSELFIMNADGTNVQRFTDNNVIDSGPSWSPGGTRLTFNSTRNGSWEVYVIDLATLHVTQLTGLDGDKAAASPDWSPDGTQIVYEKFTDFGKDIYIMSADGTNQRPFLRGGDPDPNVNTLRFFPRWSADGRSIVFDEGTLQDGIERYRLYIVRLGGRSFQIKELYNKLGDNLFVGYACWAYNDKSLILDIKLLDEPNPNYDIYRYDLNTRALKRLTDGDVHEGYPDWIEGALPVAPKEKKSPVGDAKTGHP